MDSTNSDTWAREPMVGTTSSGYDHRIKVIVCTDSAAEPMRMARCMAESRVPSRG